MDKALRILSITLLVCLLPLPALSQVKGEWIKVPSDIVLNIHTTPSKELWISTNDGIAYLGIKREYLSPPGSSKLVWEVTTDPTGKAWVATAAGIYVFDPETKSFKTIVENLPASAITVDAANAVWVGTVGYGIVKIVNEEAVAWFRTTDGLPSNHLTTIFSSSDGKIWAGTAGGLAVLEGTNWRAVPVLQGRRVFSMTEYSGKLVVGTDNGVYFSGDFGVRWHELQGTEGKVVTAVQKFQKDLIIGTKDAELLVYSTRVYPIEEFMMLSIHHLSLNRKILGLSSDAITSIVAKGDESLLLGSYGGGVKAFSSDEWMSLKQTAVTK